MPNGMNINQCDIRTSDTINEGLLAETKGLLLLGEKAMHEWTTDCEGYTLNEKRGTPLTNSWNLPCLASYLPQDVVDFTDHESRLNPLASYEEQEEKEDDTQKHKGCTARSNYRFWLIQDTFKILKRLPSSPSAVQQPLPNIKIYPSSKDIIDILRETKNQTIVIDIETDELQQINCIGLGIGDTIYIVPILRFNYTLAYDNLHEILAALAIGLSSNLVIGHNIAAFDLLVLAWRYRVPCGKRNYDTMLAFHRMFPEAERSLGHAMSHLTWEPYHKDEGAFAPKTREAEAKLWNYNAKDILGTKLVYEELVRRAARIPGLTESIAQSNALIEPTLVTTLQGMRYDQTKLEAIMADNDRLCTQYVRLIKLAIGADLYKQIQAKSDKNMPGSNKQCVRYFHDTMGYKVMGKTETGNASLKADLMYRLKLKYPENFVADLVLAYRERAKESGSLKFTPWVL